MVQFPRLAAPSTWGELDRTPLMVQIPRLVAVRSRFEVAWCSDRRPPRRKRQQWGVAGEVVCVVTTTVPGLVRRSHVHPTRRQPVRQSQNPLSTTWPEERRASATSWTPSRSISKSHRSRRPGKAEQQQVDSETPPEVFHKHRGWNPLIVKDLDLYPQPPTNTRSPTLNSEVAKTQLNTTMPPSNALQ